MIANGSTQNYSTVDSSLPAKGVIPRKLSSTGYGKPAGISYEFNVAMQYLRDERTRVSPWVDPSIFVCSSIRRLRSSIVVASGISRIRRHLSCFWCSSRFVAISLGFVANLRFPSKEGGGSIITDESGRFKTHMVFSILLSTFCSRNRIRKSMREVKVLSKAGG